MTATYVQVLCDLLGPDGEQLQRGQVLFTPSAALADVPDGQLIPPKPVIAGFSGSGAPAVTLLASDNSGPQPSGWTWGAEFTIAGNLAPFSFYVPAGPVPFTATAATPSVLTWTPNGNQAWELLSIPVGTGVMLSGGSLPSGFIPGALYFAASSSAYMVELAAYPGGPALGSVSAGSGSLTVVQYRLSGLSPVQAVTPMASYLTVPAGTPAAGNFVLATGPTAWEWATPSMAGFAPLASPALTGTPTAPTAAALTDSTQIATTAYADAAVGVEKTRAQAAEALLAPKASPALTGTPTAPTAPALTSSTQVATTAYADSAVGVERARALTAEALLAPLASPALTGSPTAPTQTTGDNSAKIATDAFVAAAVAPLAPLASPALTGTPTAPTPTTGDNSTKLATTSFVQAALGAGLTFSAKGQTQYSTTYVAGNVLLHNGEYILIVSTVTTGSGTNGLGTPFISAADYVKLSSQGYFWTSDYGVVGNGTTDDWAALQALLILVRSLSSNSFKGFTVIAQGGKIAVSKTVVIPTQTEIWGQGLYGTTIALLNNAGCDVIQPEEYNSTSQAALLTTLQPTLTASALVNAYRWGLRNLTVHGNYAGQAPGSYHHGLSVQTSPLTSTASSDPDFDPAGIVDNVQFRDCSGDGFNHAGRSALRLSRCIAWFNQGNGFSPSFDTQHDHCQAGFNGIAGWYFNHGANQGSGNKSYNNGTIQAWTSGSNYAVMTRVSYSGAYYDAVNALTSDTVAPPSDPTNWALVTVTSPAAWGAGVYFDSNAGEITFNCDCQENSSHNWWFHNCTIAGIFVSGVSANPNWNQGTSAVNTTNPNYYSALCIDGAAGVQAAISCGDPSGHVSTCYRLRMVNAPARCDITLTGDANATMLTPDSVALLGSGNIVAYNGKNYTSTLSTLNDVSAPSPANGEGLFWDSTTSQWTAQSPPGGFYGGVFGKGTLGAVTLDGTTAYSGFTLSGGSYTLQPAYMQDTASSLTVNSGVTLNLANLPLQVAGTITNNGTIACNGGSASGSSAGASSGSGMYGTQAGRAGGTGAGAGGYAQSGTIAGGVGGAGGTGSSGAGGAGGTVSNSTRTYPFANPSVPLTGLTAWNGTTYNLAGGSGGGAGGGDGTNSGGGSGAGAGIAAIFAQLIANNGAIQADGGAGGTPATGNCGGGGGGGGGTVAVYTLTAVSGTGTITAAGGTGGSPAGTGTAGSAGAAGQVIQQLLA